MYCQFLANKAAAVVRYRMLLCTMLKKHNTTEHRVGRYPHLARNSGLVLKCSRCSHVSSVHFWLRLDCTSQAECLVALTRFLITIALVACLHACMLHTRNPICGTNLCLACRLAKSKPLGTCDSRLSGKYGLASNRNSGLWVS